MNGDEHVFEFFFFWFCFVAITKGFHLTSVSLM